MLPEHFKEPAKFYITHPKQRRAIKSHWGGVLQWFESHINNGILEGINSQIQAAKAKSRGYRTNKNLIAMIYRICGKFKFGLPT